MTYAVDAPNPLIWNIALYQENRSRELPTAGLRKCSGLALELIWPYTAPLTCRKPIVSRNITAIEIARHIQAKLILTQIFRIIGQEKRNVKTADDDVPSRKLRVLVTRK